MRVVPILVVLLILPTVIGEGGGINSEHDLTGTPIESLSYPASFTALGEEIGKAVGSANFDVLEDLPSLLILQPMHLELKMLASIEVAVRVDHSDGRSVVLVELGRARRSTAKLAHQETRVNN